MRIRSRMRPLPPRDGQDSVICPTRRVRRRVPPGPALLRALGVVDLTARPSTLLSDRDAAFSATRAGGCLDASGLTGSAANWSTTASTGEGWDPDTRAERGPP